MNHQKYCIHRISPYDGLCQTTRKNINSKQVHCPESAPRREPNPWSEILSFSPFLVCLSVWAKNCCNKSVHTIIILLLITLYATLSY